MKKYYLVTSSDKETWAEDHVNIFLGEWCKLYLGKEDWKKLDCSTVKYHWDDRKKLKIDSIYLENLQERILGDLVSILNKTHQVNHSKLYWRIVVGPWLSTFVSIVFDKWCMINKAVTSFPITDIKIKKNINFSHVPKNLEEYIALSVSISWHEDLNARIIKKSNFKPALNINEIISSKKIETGTSKKLRKSKFRRRLDYGLDSLNFLFSGKDDFFFYKSYFNKRIQALVEIRLKQAPVFWTHQSYPHALNSEIVERKFDWSYAKKNEGFESLLRDLIEEYMPLSYLENFKTLSEYVDNLRWPSSPRVIFSSSSFSYDDVFNFWAAGKIEAGALLVTGQHGGNCGVSEIDSEFDHQKKISKKIFTWGLSEIHDKKFIPVGNFKLQRKNLKRKKDGHLLLIQNTIPQHHYRLYSSPMASQWLDYHSQQEYFVNNLSDQIKSKTIIRKHRIDSGWSQSQRWKKDFPDIDQDDGTRPINELYGDSRLVVITNHGTSHLESMFLNIPTLIFWDESRWELGPSFKPCFDLLKKVGIFHESPESASKKINEIWNQAEDWWAQEDVQLEKNKFLEVLSRKNMSITKTISDELYKISL